MKASTKHSALLSASQGPLDHLDIRSQVMHVNFVSNWNYPLYKRLGKTIVFVAERQDNAFITIC